MFRSQYLSTRFFSRQFICSDCGGSEAYRSRRRTFLEKFILPVFLLQPARCANCFLRTRVLMFKLLRDRAQKPDVKHPAAA